MKSLRLLFAGLIFLLLALVGVVLLSFRSFPKEMSTSSVPGEYLISPTLGPTSTTTQTPTNLPTPTATKMVEMTYMPPTITPTSLPTKTPTKIHQSLPYPTLIPTQMPTVVIEAELPKKMELERSDSIRVSLVRTAGQIYVPTIEVTGHRVFIVSPNPVGTLGAPIENAFGSGYEAFATAHIAAAAFNFEPVTPEEQSLDQSRINWEWNIVPKNEGQQIINLSITVSWKPKSGEQIIERQIWLTQFNILVEKPLIATGQIDILTLISGCAGSGLSIPWIYERIKGRTKKQPAGKGTKH